MAIPLEHSGINILRNSILGLFREVNALELHLGSRVQVSQLVSCLWVISSDIFMDRNVDRAVKAISCYLS